MVFSTSLRRKNHRYESNYRAETILFLLGSSPRTDMVHLRERKTLTKDVSDTLTTQKFKPWISSQKERLWFSKLESVNFQKKPYFWSVRVFRLLESQK